jgi:hypothetical protein
MKSIFFKVWKDSVWSKVIAVGITGTGLFLWNIFSINTFNISYPIPIWALFILALLILPCLFKIFGTVISSFIRKPFDPEANRSRIEKAIYEKRKITGFDLLWTGIRNDNSFLEFCMKDFSETWLVQEISDPILTTDIKRQIRIVNRHLADREARHDKVIIILLVYRILSIGEKTDLFNQLLLFNFTENLIQKITFQVWDKSDIDKILED